MRRKDRELSKKEAYEILKKGEFGILSTADKNGMPYGLPINYALHDNNIICHGALEGLKIDNLRAREDVSFSSVGKTQVLAKEFATIYESAIVLGKASIIEDKEEKKKLLYFLVEKYSPNYLKEGKEYIEELINITSCIKINIIEITGKARYV